MGQQLNYDRMSRSSGRSYLLTDWVTVSGNTASVGTVVQDAEYWLDLPSCADVTTLTEVSQVSPPATAAGLVMLNIESSPTPDEGPFLVQPVAGPIICTAGTTPVVKKTMSGSGTPLGRFLRWRITTTGTGAWSVTFRIRVVCNRANYFSPPMMGNCAVWYVADRGIQFSGTNISAWNDQSGLSSATKNLTPTFTPSYNVADPLYAGQPTFTFQAANHRYFSSGMFTTPVSPISTWVVVGHRTNAAALMFALDANTAMPMSGQSIQATAAGAITINAGMALTAVGLPWTNTPHMVLAEFNDPNSKIFYDSVTTSSVVGMAGNQLMPSVAIGSVNPLNGGPLNWWDGNIAEVIGFNFTLTTTQKALLRTYLNNRYGLAIT